MAGEWVNVQADGGIFRAYLSVPEKGSGPGIVLCQEIFGVTANLRAAADHFAEEGYTVIVPDLFWRIEPNVELSYSDADTQRALAINSRFDLETGLRDIAATIAALKKVPSCKGRIGALGYCLGGKLAALTAARGGVDCAVSYYGVGLERHLDQLAKISVPMIFHFAGKDQFVPATVVSQVKAVFAGLEEVSCYEYPDVDHGFSSPTRKSYDRNSALMAHSRTLGLFKRVMGPHFNLVELWEQHLGFEFDTQDLEGTMATMVKEPYVNVVPTLTGGVGQSELRNFYQNHFIFQSPPDTKIIPISCTIGADRVVDEQVFCFTHDRVIDWLLPGVPPTGKYVEVPLIAIASFRGGKLYNEHIYWDQASVLVQVGLLDPDTLPVVGVEQAKKLKDPASLPSNSLIPTWRPT